MVAEIRPIPPSRRGAGPGPGRCGAASGGWRCRIATRHPSDRRSTLSCRNLQATFQQPRSMFNQPCPRPQHSGARSLWRAGAFMGHTALHALDTDVPGARHPFTTDRPARSCRWKEVTSSWLQSRTPRPPGSTRAPTRPAVDQLDLEIAGRRVPRPRRPLRLRQVHQPAHARRSRGRRRGRDLHRRPRRHQPARRRPATSRWSSRTTRSTRT